MIITLIEKRNEAEGVKSFYFSPEKPIKYLPGQYFYIRIPELQFPDERGNTRHFTISSSPTEDNFIRITTKMRPESGFKKTLETFKIGEKVEGDGPSGYFVFSPKDLRPQVFIAGGIGITPFRSMIKYSTDKSLDIPIYLIYSNSIPQEIVFADELREIEAKNSNIHIFHTITKPENSKLPWTGHIGRIDHIYIENTTRDLENPVFWVCGPPSMVDTIETELDKLQVPEENIKSEKFTGY